MNGKNVKFLGLAVLLLLIIGGVSAAQVTSSTRDLPTTANIDTDFNITVFVDINNADKPGSYVVVEEVPIGFAIVSAPKGSVDGRTVFWFVANSCSSTFFTIDCPVEDKTFTYTVRTSNPSTYEFTGRVSTNNDETVETTGDIVLTVGSGNGGADTTAPIVGGISPTSGTINVAQTYSVGVSDNVGVASCNLFVDNQEVKAMSVPDSCTSCTSSVNHTFTSSGTFSVFASCQDQAGNVKNGSAVNVVISNPVQDTTSPTITNVQAFSVTSSTAVISWTTNENSDSLVEYGETISYGNSKSNSTLLTSHSVQLTGLNSGTTYQFRVKSKDASNNLATSGNFVFTTSQIVSDRVNVFRDLPNLVNVNIDFNVAYDIQINESQNPFSYLVTENIPQGIEIVNSSGNFYDQNQRKLYIQGNHQVGKNEDRIVSIMMKATSSGTFPFNGQIDLSTGTFTVLGDQNLAVGSGGSTSVPPVISNVQVSSLTSTSATITWNTDKSSNSLVQYGQTTSYGNAESDPSMGLSHLITINGLTPNTLYHFRVQSTDTDTLTSTSGDFTFTTPAIQDTTAPVISNIQINGITPNTAIISWTTNEPSDSIVEYGKTISYGQSKTVTGLVTSHSVQLTGLNAGTTFQFRVKSRDASNNLATSGNNNFTTTQQSNFSLKFNSVNLLNGNFIQVSEIAPGSQYNVRAVIRNDGVTDIEPMQIVQILDGNTPINIGTVKSKVRPGETSEITVGFTLPSTATSGKIFTIKIFNWNTWISQGGWAPLSDTTEINLITG